LITFFDLLAAIGATDKSDAITFATLYLPYMHLYDGEEEENLLKLLMDETDKALR
jgi:hypothetical protein